ncbi:hypothetical protein BH23GEM3_BH23GEM3_17680 [soil metagenome]|nr:hypothetical protein [Gemmatimonadota bacterium]
MMLRLLLANVFLIGACLATPAAAQLRGIPLSVEIHAGALVPLGGWEVRGRETALQVGVGPLFSGALRLTLPAGFSVYSAYHRALPRCEECDLFGLSDQLVDSGLGLGIGYALPALLPVPLRLDVGGIAHQLAFRGGGQNRASELGFGGEAGLISSFEIRPSFFAEPAISGRAYTARYEFEEGISREVAVRYVVPRIGLRYSF